MKIKRLISLTIIATLIIIIGFIAYRLYFPKTGYFTYEEEAILYLSPNCGCCMNYAGYLEQQGIRVKKVYMNDISSIKTQYNIPGNMQTCHTTILGEYFIEGHVPIESITKLLEEQPNITGIALPDMPSGSPGMSGSKLAPFNIYAIDHDGISIFTTI